MKILITGAAGFIGSHLAARLSLLGHTVVGIDCLTDYYSMALKELNVGRIRRQGVRFLPLDLAADDLSPAVEEVQAVFHLAAQPGISATTTFDTYMQNNLVATHRLVAALRPSSSLQGLINISTSSVYGVDATGDESTETKPTSYYGVTKLAAEQLVLSFTRDQGFPACSLRLFSVYGPRERPEKLYPQLIASILEGRQLPLYEGSEHHVRSYTYVDDIVDGLVAALENLGSCIGEIFNIGTDVSITTADGIKIVEDIIGKPARTTHKPKRPGDQQRTQANIDKARRLLGYNPTTTAREGLAKEVEWYQQHIYGKINLWPDRD
jgi:nucleoside-diphosphate-sugar epimerase